MTILKGSREPTFCSLNVDEYDDFLEIEKLRQLQKTFNVELLAWQEDIIVKLLKKENDKKLLLELFACIVPRQNGKSELLLFYVIVSLLLGRSGIFSAHLASTVQDAFFRIKSMISGSVLGYKFVFSSDSAKLWWVSYNGNKFYFQTRGGSSSFGRGLTKLDIVIFDEAQEVTESQIATVDAVTAVSLSPQKILMGTSPLPEYDGTTGAAITKNPFFTQLKEKILNSNSVHQLWQEWSTTSIGSPEDEEIIAKTNPSYGHDLGFGRKITMASFSSSSSNLIFSIERLGYQVTMSPYGNDRILDSIKMQYVNRTTIKKEFSPRQKYTVGIKSSFDGKKVYIVKTLKGKDLFYGGLVHVYDSVEDRDNINDFILLELRKLRCENIYIDGIVRNQIRSFLVSSGKWDASKNSSTQGKITFITFSHYIAACAVFKNTFDSNRFCTSETHKEYYNKYFDSLQRRKTRGEGFGFQSASVPPEIADALALSVFSHNN